MRQTKQKSVALAADQSPSFEQPVAQVGECIARD